MQPIDPPFGGGRARLLGVYHALGPTMPTTYVGTYDWPGPEFRRHSLSETLEEIDVPLSSRHFEIHERWRGQTGAPTVIDVLFPLMVGRSPEFLSVAREQISSADIAMFSHPWVYSAVRGTVDHGRQLLVYDSHNVESLIKSEFLFETPLGREVGRFAAVTECELARESDLILACSAEDALYFHALYGADIDKIIVVPNGTFVDHFDPPSAQRRRAVHQELGAEGHVVAFMGSGYGPNLEAANFICSEIAPAFPNATFIICGNVGDLISPAQRPDNVRMLGLVSDQAKRSYLQSSSAAVNPMFSGSGTNVKMFDFMAAGLPIISTAVGARGIEGAGEAFLVCEPNEMVQCLEEVLTDARVAEALGRNARGLVEEKYAWERISPGLGAKLQEALSAKQSAGATPPAHRPVSTNPPFGLQNSGDQSKLILVGTCGPMRPGNGMLELIEAISILGDSLEGIALLALTSLDTSAECKQHLAECEALIQRLGLARRVTIMTDSPANVRASLTDCDMTVLLDGQSAEETSAAAQMAFASGRPLITRRSDAFSEFASYSYQTETADPYVLALAMANVACNRSLAKSLVAKSLEFRHTLGNA